MKKIVQLVLALSVVLLPLTASAALSGTARLTLVDGDVQIRMADSDDWVPAAANTPLEEGDSIWSPQGARAEIQLKDGSYIRLGSDTSLDIVDVSDDVMQFHMAQGRAYVRTGAAGDIDYQFDLAESTITVSDRARLSFDVAPDGGEEISVVSGTAYVEGYGGRTRVRSGTTLTVDDARSEVLPLKQADAWDKWNRNRDKELNRQARSARYLPDELAIYEDELSASGEWVVVPEYGRIWRPRVSVTVDWAPFRSGRWIWRGGDYVWIGFEPWGWAPYHYGRWVVTPRFGWCWVPPVRGDVFWAPAYVGWVHTPDHIGWVPLAPGEVYYGRGYYGRGSVNISTVTNFGDVSIGTRFSFRNHERNRNALTVIDRDSFSRGRYERVRLQDNLLHHERARIGRPEPPRIREIRMPVIKPVPPGKLPPPRVTSVPARELKHQLPRIGKPGASPSAGRPDRGATDTPSASGPAQIRSSAPATDRHYDERRPDALGRNEPALREKRTRFEKAEPSPPVRSESAPIAVPPASPSPPAASEPRSVGPRVETPARRVPRNVWRIQPRDEGRQGPSARPQRPQKERQFRERDR